MQAHGEHHREPHRVEVQLGDHRADQRQDDQGEFKPVEEESEQEGRDQDADHDAGGAERQTEQDALDQLVAAEATQHQGEADGAEDRSEDERGGARRFLDHLRQHFAAERTFQRGQQQSAGSTHAGRFGGCRQAEEDAAEHRQNERRCRHHGEKQLPGGAQVHGFGGHRRGLFRLQPANAEQVGDVQAAEQDAPGRAHRGTESPTLMAMRSAITTSMMLGGIRMPSVPTAQTVPDARCLS